MMENNLQIFKNEQFGEVRTVTINNEVWFVGKDVAKALGYSNLSDALRTHVDNDDKTIIQKSENTTLDIPNRGLTIINESGLYSLILSSKLSTAKQFKRWVTNEVLPSIRKYGSYSAQIPKDYPSALRAYATAIEDKEKLAKQIEEDKPKVALAHSITASKTSILIGELAKILKQNGINIGQNRLFKWLRENGYLISRVGQSKNCPTQKAMEKGLFEIKETIYHKANGEIGTNLTPMVTGKGQLYFVNKFRNDMNVRLIA